MCGCNCGCGFITEDETVGVWAICIPLGAGHLSVLGHDSGTSRWCFGILCGCNCGCGLIDEYKTEVWRVCNAEVQRVLRWPQYNCRHAFNRTSLVISCKILSLLHAMSPMVVGDINVNTKYPHNAWFTHFGQGDISMIFVFSTKYSSLGTDGMSLISY